MTMQKPFTQHLTAFFILVILLGAPLSLFFLNDGFCKKSITSKMPFTHLYDLSISPEDHHLASLALEQPYTYLSSGSQCYVFKSQDEQFVLKFFKDKKWFSKSILNKIPLPFVLNKYRQKRIERTKRTLRRSFESSLISFKIFKKETGMVYLSLCPKTHIPKGVILKDRLGIKHSLDLTTVPFIIQHMAKPMHTYLLEKRKKGETNKAKEAISLLLNFKLAQAQKGYNDKDPHPIRNFGFLQAQIIEIDNGGFYVKGEKSLDFFYLYEMKEMEEKLLSWMEQNYPELKEHTKAKIKQIKTNSTNCSSLS